jgi:hypothetical protein
VEADALVGVEDGALPEHGFEAPHATDDIGDLDLAEDVIALGLDLLQQLALRRDDGLESGFEVGFCGVGAARRVGEGLSMSESSSLYPEDFQGIERSSRERTLASLEAWRGERMDMAIASIARDER